MKEYTALHYVKDSVGSLHTPGEIFDSEYAKETEERLVRVGAIRVNGDEHIDAADPFERETIEEEEFEETDDELPIVIDAMDGISAPKKGRKK